MLCIAIINANNYIIMCRSAELHKVNVRSDILKANKTHFGNCKWIHLHQTKSSKRSRKSTLCMSMQDNEYNVNKPAWHWALIYLHWIRTYFGNSATLGIQWDNQKKMTVQKKIIAPYYKLSNSLHPLALEAESNKVKNTINLLQPPALEPESNSKRTPEIIDINELASQHEENQRC